MGLSLHERWLAPSEEGHHLGVLGTPFEEAWRMQLQRHPIDVQLKVQSFALPQASRVRDRSLAEL